MNFSLIFGVTAGVISLLAIIPYISSILQGRTKPNRISWLIWSFAATSLAFSYYYSGATTTVWLAVSGAVMAVSVFILSLKYGVGGYGILDIFCLLGSILGLIVWACTKNPTAALYINILVDLLAFLPTVKKTWLYPTSESRLSWNLATLANACNVLALTRWELRIVLFPIYNLILNATVALLAYGILRKGQSYNNQISNDEVHGLF